MIFFSYIYSILPTSFHWETNFDIHKDGNKNVWLHPSLYNGENDRKNI